jgi:hypothetical protein
VTDEVESCALVLVVARETLAAMAEASTSTAAAFNATVAGTWTALEAGITVARENDDADWGKFEAAIAAGRILSKYDAGIVYPCKYDMFELNVIAFPIEFPTAGPKKSLRGGVAPAPNLQKFKFLARKNRVQSDRPRWRPRCSY